MPFATVEQHREYHRSRYHQNKDARLAYLSREDVKERERQRAAVYRAANREKIKARNAVNNAIRDGRLIRLACEGAGCSDPDTQAHHTDYTKPLDVQWLCRTCHDRAHGKETFKHVDLKVNGQEMEA